ncbi:hypothetical protein LEP1GSC060_3259 [Leptospira weilii serovar Ranarum str. ICFT]|uniref:Uncharacterized protein n=1 Tax=Leptospira weilii serovar Ranarum str. ICFT TaxID=1218598 RepID=N1WCN8_9LEPT|nr:hypothetical protein LEP1GSC060_3259 [Leptospira weilii serovar Ranarum str. ICFT]
MPHNPISKNNKKSGITFDSALFIDFVNLKLSYNLSQNFRTLSRHTRFCIFCLNESRHEISKSLKSKFLFQKTHFWNIKD